MKRKIEFRTWLQKNRNLKTEALRDYISRIKRVEQNTLNGTDIDGLMMNFYCENGFQKFENFLEIFQKNGPHNMVFNTDNPDGVLSNIRTALTAYYFFYEEIPSLYESEELTSLKFDKSQIEEINVKFLKSTFINRLNTQDRLYPNLNNLCFTPRIYNDKKFGELIENLGFFKTYQNDIINKTFFYLGRECTKKYYINQIESIVLVNNKQYCIKLKNGVVKELMGKNRDGRFGQLYKQDDNILSSITLDHAKPISKIIENLYYGNGLPGITGISDIIAEVSAEFKIPLKSAARPWKRAEFKNAVFEHPKMNKKLAFLIKSELEKISELMTLELMQQRENSGKGNRN